jgi:hypothetical protein
VSNDAGGSWSAGGGAAVPAEELPDILMYDEGGHLKRRRAGS